MPFRWLILYPFFFIPCHGLRIASHLHSLRRFHSFFCLFLVDTTPIHGLFTESERIMHFHGVISLFFSLGHDTTFLFSLLPVTVMAIFIRSFLFLFFGMQDLDRDLP